MATAVTVTTPGAGQAYVDWTVDVKAAGGVATAWPFADDYQGGAAARYPAATYAQLYNAGAIDPTAPQQATPNNSWVYVLASRDVQLAAPATMTAAQRAANALFTMGDSAADAIGLPSLEGIENVLDNVKTLAIVAGAVLLVVAVRRTLK